MKCRILIIGFVLVIVSFAIWIFTPKWSPDGISAPINYLRKSATQKLKSIEVAGKNNQSTKPQVFHVEKNGSRIGTLILLPNHKTGASIIIIDADGKGEIWYEGGGLDKLTDTLEEISIK